MEWDILSKEWKENKGEEGNIEGGEKKEEEKEKISRLAFIKVANNGVQEHFFP